MQRYSPSLREFVLPYIQIRNRRKGYAVSIVKAGMKAIGRPAGPVRPPLTDLTEAELHELDQAHRRTVLTLAEAKQTHVRYLIISILFAVSCFSYGDRVALSIAGTAMAKDISLDPVKMGYLFSGFSWAYVLGQLAVRSVARPFRIEAESTASASWRGRSAPCSRALPGTLLRAPPSP